MANAGTGRGEYYAHPARNAGRRCKCGLDSHVGFRCAERRAIPAPVYRALWYGKRPLSGLIVAREFLDDRRTEDEN
jgi:hypothetical protein